MNTYKTHKAQEAFLERFVEGTVVDAVWGAHSVLMKLSDGSLLLEHHNITGSMYTPNDTLNPHTKEWE